MSHAHVNPQTPTTVFEAVEDAGLVPAAINFTCYRGRTRHPIRLPAIAARNRWYEAVYGPQRFFFFNLFESDETGAPLAVRSRAEGSIDAYAGYDRPLARDPGRLRPPRLLPPGLRLRLPPEWPDCAARGARARRRQRVGALHGRRGRARRAARPLRACSSAPTTARRTSTESRAAPGAVRRPSAPDRAARRPGRGRARPSPRRTAAGWSTGCLRARSTSRELAERLDGRAGRRRRPLPPRTATRSRGARARSSGSARRRAAGRLAGDADVLDEARYPNGLERAWHALACPNAGEVLVSAREGFEFVDLGGRAHVGRRQPRLARRRRLAVIPLLTAGLARRPLPDGRADRGPRAARARASSASRRRRPWRSRGGARVSVSA